MRTTLEGNPAPYEKGQLELLKAIGDLRCWARISHDDLVHGGLDGINSILISVPVAGALRDKLDIKY